MYSWNEQPATCNETVIKTQQHKTCLGTAPWHHRLSWTEDPEPTTLVTDEDRSGARLKEIDDWWVKCVIMSCVRAVLVGHWQSTADIVTDHKDWWINRLCSMYLCMCVDGLCSGKTEFIAQSQNVNTRITTALLKVSLLSLLYHHHFLFLLHLSLISCILCPFVSHDVSLSCIQWRASHCQSRPPVGIA